VRRPPITAVSGPSGAGKTRLLSRLIPALAARGVRVAVLKHTVHPHAFDRPGKDTEVLRRAGAVAAAIEGPSGVAFFGPPTGSLRSLAALLPSVDLVLAEGFRDAPLPRVEVHRRAVSRAFLCAADRRVVAVVTDECPPRPLPVFAPDDVEPLASFLCARFGIALRTGERLRVRPGMRSLRPSTAGRASARGRTERMATKSTNRKSRRGARRAGSSRSEAGRKGGNATLRARGPEFYSEIGRKGGKRSGARRSAAARAGRRGATRRGTRRTGSRGSARARGR
jgi:molybdopterin-guanine dinucleotide biosynthesis protein MobB